MQNTLALKRLSIWLLVAGFLLFFFPTVHAEETVSEAVSDTASDVVNTIQDAAADIQETAKPLFDPDLVDEQKQLLPRDKFLVKMQAKRTKFVQEEAKTRREFFQKIREENLPAEDLQKKLRDFRQKELKEEAEFFKSQNEKVKKHFDQLQDKKEEEASKNNPFQKLALDRRKFLKEQEQKKQEFLKDLNKERIKGETPVEEIQAKIQKFSEERRVQMEKFSKDQQEQIEKKAAEG